MSSDILQESKCCTKILVLPLGCDAASFQVTDVFVFNAYSVSQVEFSDFLNIPIFKQTTSIPAWL